MKLVLTSRFDPKKILKVKMLTFAPKIPYIYELLKAKN